MEGVTAMEGLKEEFIEDIRRTESAGADRRSKSRYKGVIAQSNNKWGARIYTNHKRSWLGTFGSEDEAALAYDRAALKLRVTQLQSPMNILGHGDKKEFKFQAIHSSKEILDMIKDHSYEDNLRKFMEGEGLKEEFIKDIKRTESAGADRRSKSRYKGVVAQSNNKWGAKIYTNHKRSWLGTFGSEDEAALAYDRAALKLRVTQLQSPMNILGHGDKKEFRFQAIHSSKEILDMIKDHSYEDNLRKFMAPGDQLGAHASQGKNDIGDGGDTENQKEFLGKNEKEFLFRKKVTPSDISKLCRLVIPKLHADRCFPIDKTPPVKPEVLVFQDEKHRKWEFGYTYWTTSKIHVLTTGWNSFVKDKDLKAGDLLCFERFQSCNILTVSKHGDDHQDQDHNIKQGDDHQDQDHNIKHGDEDMEHDHNNNHHHHDHDHNNKHDPDHHVYCYDQDHNNNCDDHNNNCDDHQYQDQNHNSKDDDEDNHKDHQDQNQKNENNVKPAQPQDESNNFNVEVHSDSCL